MPEAETSPKLLAAGCSGSPSAASSSRSLVAGVLELLAERGWATELIDLSALPAEALLGRSEHPQVSHALGLVERARVVVIGTPVYRATYTGLLKTFFDLMPADFLVGKWRCWSRQARRPAICWRSTTGCGRWSRAWAG